MEDPRVDSKRRKRFHGDVWEIEVGVGIHKQTWNVHHDLLCKTSTFFQSAVKREWNDAETKNMSLPEDDTEAFEIYVQWLYQDKLLMLDSIPNRDPKATAKLLRCYVFGEKIQDTIFQNTIMDGIFAQIHERDANGGTWYPIDADTIYTGTPEGSPLRRLVVDCFVYHGWQQWIKSQHNVDVLFDLANKLLEIRAKPSESSPITQNASQKYHKPVQTTVAEEGKLGTGGTSGT